MLCHMSLRHEELARAGIVALDRWALLEASLVHARVLANFLDGPPKNPHPGDFFAIDFSPTWDTTTPTLPRAEIDAISKQIAHLNSKRRPGHGWQLLTLAEKVFTRVEELAARIDDEELSASLSGVSQIATDFRAGLDRFRTLRAVSTTSPTIPNVT